MEAIIVVVILSVFVAIQITLVRWLFRVNHIVKRMDRLSHGLDVIAAHLVLIAQNTRPYQRHDMERSHKLPDMKGR